MNGSTVRDPERSEQYECIAVQQSAFELPVRFSAKSSLVKNMEAPRTTRHHERSEFDTPYAVGISAAAAAATATATTTDRLSAARRERSLVAAGAG